MPLTARRLADPDHWSLASAIRVLSMDAVEAANSGHPGMPMGMADVATVLWRKHLKFDASAPNWFDRDRFILSAGHGSMLIYSLLHLTGFEQMTLDQIRNFRQWGAATAGHPEYGHAEGVETTTGPLGQGLATSVGFAMAEAKMRAEFGEELCDHRTWVIAGDGCLMEGISQEAITLAGHLRLGRLIVLWDDNRITIDGGTDLSTSTECWLLAGGPHHTVLSTSLRREHLANLATMLDVELVSITGRTETEQFAKELRWNNAYHRLAMGF